MNSLEYIDREISSTEIDLWYSKRLLIENPPNEELKKEMLEVKINVLERNMKCLQQIKAELEAWEVVKKHLEYFPSDYYNGIPEDVITMTSEIDKIDYPIIKKALEVKDE